MSKKVDRVHKIFDLADGDSRAQWEYVNQKGFDFSRTRYAYIYY